MIKFVTGDLLQSEAYALVNTVNCEGYMGKGIAYQFKLKYPEMNVDYVKHCKSHKLTPGVLHCYKTADKMIINFPTKNKWREKSKIEYIVSGLDALIQTIKEHNIPSIAIPPLGSGNGGLIWNEVRDLIIQKLSDIGEYVDIFIYESSQNYKVISTAEPELSLSALILMNIKFQLKHQLFNKIGLQKTAYFMNVLSHTEYFHFKKAQYGPYDYAIEVVCKNIKEFEKYHGVNSTDQAYDILMKKLISQSVQEKLAFYIPFIQKAAEFTNSLSSTSDVEGAGTALFIIQQSPFIDEDGIIQGFKNWSEDKAKRFDNKSILAAISSLEKSGLIVKTLCGYEITH